MWTNVDKKIVRTYRFKWFGLVREGERKTELAVRVHPTQKPVGLLAQVIEDYTDRDAIVLDVYAGSGSTLIACEKTNRKCRMMEIDCVYVDVIIRRWETFTGQKAIKL